MKVRPPERNRDMSPEMWETAQKELFKKIAEGRDSESAVRGLNLVFDEMMDSVFRGFIFYSSSDNPEVDRYRFLVLHLKGRLLEELRSVLSERVQAGRAANEELSERLEGGQ